MPHLGAHKNTGVRFMGVHGGTRPHKHTQFAQAKARAAFLVISAPSESIWWIECLEVLRLTDGTRILNAAQKGTLHHPGDIYTQKHTYGYTKTGTKRTHLHADTLTLRKTDTAMHLNNLDSKCLKTFFFPWEPARVALGIRGGITGLILSQGCRLLPLKFPPPQMKVAVEVEGGMQVFQLFNSSKLFDLLSGVCKSQVEDSPGLWALCVASLLSRVQLCGPKNLCSFQQMNFKGTFVTSLEWRRKVLTHLRVSAAHPVSSFKTVSIGIIYLLSYYPHSKVQ